MTAKPFKTLATIPHGPDHHTTEFFHKHNIGDDHKLNINCYGFKWYVDVNGHTRAIGHWLESIWDEVPDMEVPHSYTCYMSGEYDTRIRTLFLRSVEGDKLIISVVAGILQGFDFETSPKQSQTTIGFIGNLDKFNEYLSILNIDFDELELLDFT